ncbi:MAG: hypothetical protein EBS87_11860 [Sphingomonadaceae bacterium]|nr:hypothetical protein [Sphingomonadaceae bacterium]
MKIKTWQERCEEHPAHEGIVTEDMIRERMQEEIDELRREIKRLRSALSRMISSTDSWAATIASDTLHIKRKKK